MADESALHLGAALVNDQASPVSEPARLDKRVAAQLGCSRARARQLIEGGWVALDGVVCERPQAPVAGERIEIAETARPEPVAPATLLVNKPAGERPQAVAERVGPATRDPLDDSDMRPLHRHFHGLRVLLPLEDEASGLLVLSQDERVRRRLSEDRSSIEQEFVVEVAGTLVPYGLFRLAHGLSWQGRALPPCKVSWQSETRLRFAIKNVQPGQLRHMCAEVGLAVQAIRRLRIGRVSLARTAVGAWRYLPTEQRF